mmetsp:Transcript_29939/g.46960  ORF Transcript_29939/g.46960 Transcript_29939/m.46960 type:complete len:93 (+) Transcript_29939:344-622(+)
METKNNLLSNLCSACCFGQNYSRYKDAEKDGVQKGSNEGEGLILGGTWVIGAKEQGILFEFKAKSWYANAPGAANFERKPPDLAPCLPYRSP